MLASFSLHNMLKPPSYSKIQKPLLHPPTYVAYKNIRFLITDTPCINNMSRYIKVNETKEKIHQHSSVHTHSTSPIRSLRGGMWQMSFDAARPRIHKPYWISMAFKSTIGRSRTVLLHPSVSLMNGWIWWMSDSSIQKRIQTSISMMRYKSNSRA